LQDGDRGARQRVPIPRPDPEQPPELLGRTVTRDGVLQRQHPVQTGDRLPDPQPAEVRTEMQRIPADQVLEPQAGFRSVAEPDVADHLRAALGPVPARLGVFEQIAFEPCRFVFGVAPDTFHAGDPPHHPAQLRAVAEIHPVRLHAPAQVAGPPDVQDLPGVVPETVDAGAGRQLPNAANHQPSVPGPTGRVTARWIVRNECGPGLAQHLCRTSS